MPARVEKHPDVR